ncbi:hypothetical protein JD844_000150 [Phrynosoma platyrhinos]|uniref:Uncharacterized protein n=1 Tax=Phrynosoma platyrhinos TaxID=52577 RepID=A0ABQ7SQD7_PHRPL|nr:hypothetical protein JD844_000150 [Phrynosoma platyrhinos]
MWPSRFANTGPQQFQAVLSGALQKSEEEDTLKSLHQFLPHIKHLKIVFDQSKETIRKDVTHILDLLAKQNHKLQALCIECRGENPYFYSGQDILQSIKNVCQSENKINLQQLDFRKMPFTLDDGMVHLVASSSPNLHTLFINNRTLVCNVKPETMVEVLRVCPKLSILGVYYASLSEEVFQELVKPNRSPLKCLDIFCERLDKYIPVIPEDLWAAVNERYPKLRVEMEFDHTVPAWKIPRILKPTIPVTTLQLNTYTYMVNQIRFVTSSYSRTLETLVLRTTPSDDLNASLIDLAKKCVRLKEIHCYCVVSQVVNLRSSFEDESSEEMHLMLARFLQSMEHIRYLKMTLDQARAINRKKICNLLDAMASCRCKLRALCIVCSGTSPFFYSGQDILQCIRRVCYNPDKTAFRHLDFREIPFLLDNSTVGMMAVHSPHLRTLMINNHATGVTMLKPETIIELLIRCPKLSTLGVSYVVLSVGMFQKLLDPDREPFKFLDIYYNGMDCHIPDEIWTAMAERHPKFRVGIEFAAVVHARKMAQMFRPSIPVSTLHFNNFAYMVDQLGLAARYYSRTLEVLQLFAVASRDLNQALIELAKSCARLKEIHCYCVVSIEVVNAFLQHCPNLKTYTLPTERWYSDRPPTVYL